MQNEVVRKNKKRGNFPFFVLLFSIILTIGATVIFYQSAKSKDGARFKGSVNRIHFSMENRIGLYVALLKAGRGFIESANNLDRKKYENFIQSLEIEKNYFGAQGIGYSKTVRKDELEKFNALMQSEGFENYKVHPETEKDVFQPVVYLEPFNERNQKAIGFDMASEENRRLAMQKAQESGNAAATSKLILLQETEQDKQFGFIIYLPIYEGGEFTNKTAKQPKNLRGFVYSPFRANNFLKDVQSNAGTNDIFISIYDGEPTAENLMAQTDSGGAQNLSDKIGGTYSMQDTIEIAGRRWVVQYDSLPAFAEQSSVGWTPLIFLTGLLFSLLLFGMTYWETATRAKLQKTADELAESEHQIQGLLEKEKSARKTAEAANATKDEFISVVSHELRTPLNAIAGWARILKSEDLSENTKMLALQKIEKNLRLQTDLVEDLLNYSQLISTKENLEAVEIDFSDVFESVFPEFKKNAGEKSIELLKENNLNGQKIFGDADKLKIVISSLLSNAIKFTPAKGTITALIEQTDNFIIIQIKDSGKGVDPEFLPQIFDRFSQYDSSTTRNFGGLGLGLAVTEHIVKLHGGTIRAESEGEGKGATFSVKLPVIVH